MILNFFPRTMMIGLTGQFRVDSMDEVKKVIQQNNGKESLYISHNSFPGEWYSIKYDAKFVRIHQLFFDFDHKTKLENALHDVRILSDWHDENKLGYRINFSGSKGFHLYTEMNPAVYSLTEEVHISQSKKQNLTSYYRSLFNFLKNELKLRTMDPKCREPRRICRVSNTVHMGAKKYCIPLSKTEVDSLSPSEILSLADNPRKEQGIFNFPPNFRSLKFHEFIDEFQIHTKAEDTYIPGTIKFVPYKEGEGKKWELLKKHMPPGYPCILNNMNTSNPKHIARFASAAYWKQISDNSPIITDENGNKKKYCYTPKWVDDFYRFMQYDDVEYENIRKDQIDSIWNNSYKLPSCMTIYETKDEFENSICIGEECPKFEKYIKKKKVKKNEP